MCDLITRVVHDTSIPESNRRSFLKVVGGALAMGGAAGVGLAPSASAERPTRAPVEVGRRAQSAGAARDGRWPRHPAGRALRDLDGRRLPGPRVRLRPRPRDAPAAASKQPRRRRRGGVEPLPGPGDLLHPHAQRPPHGLAGHLCDRSHRTRGEGLPQRPRSRSSAPATEERCRASSRRPDRPPRSTTPSSRPRGSSA